MTTTKIFIGAQSFLEDSIRLGNCVWESGFRPDFIVGVWRGGCPTAMVIHDLFKYYGHTADHIAIRTSRYSGIDTTYPIVQVHSLDYLRNTLKTNQSILIVDDVYDSGNSFVAILNALSNLKYSEIRIATVWYKPGRNEHSIAPDYYVNTGGSNDWLVFPHEFEGLTENEILKDKKINLKTLV